MPLKLSPLAFLLLLFLPTHLSAQDNSKPEMAKITTADFTVPASTVCDSSSAAVILSDLGSLRFEGNKTGWFSYIFKRHTRIKIVKGSAYGLATIAIPLYVDGRQDERLENLEGTTYNFQNGKIVETRLSKNDVFTNKKNKNHIEKKFSLPAVKEGAVIEYSYIIVSDFIENLPSWQFQWNQYPCLRSEYSIVIPNLMNYALVRKGIHPFSSDKTDEGSEVYRVSSAIKDARMSSIDQNYSVNARTLKRSWAMRDIPPFEEENYISSPVNYMDEISFQLSETFNGAHTERYNKTWKEFAEGLMREDYFGNPVVSPNDWLDDSLSNIVFQAPGKLEEAKAIYYYLTSRYTCNDYNNYFLTTTLIDVFRKRQGTVGELNLLLTAMLRQRRIPADPVVLSTRDHGYIFTSYPVLETFNYVVCRVRLNGVVYYLDASHPQFGFGQLPLACYNGPARIISDRDSGFVYFYPDSLKENKRVSVFISTTEKNTLEGNYESMPGMAESDEVREKIRTGNKNVFFKTMQSNLGDEIAMANPGIDSLSAKATPVKIYYDFKCKWDTTAAVIYFNPVIGDGYKENPFKASERKYPVDLPYVSDKTYTLNMDVPKGYIAEEMPSPAKISLNGQDGFFEYIIANGGSNIQLRIRLKINRARFQPEDYTALRDFFSFVIKKEAEPIVFKKRHKE